MMAISYIDPPNAVHRTPNLDPNTTINYVFPTLYRGILIGMASGNFDQDFVYLVKTSSSATSSPTLIPIVQAANVTLTPAANQILTLANAAANRVNIWSIELSMTDPPVLAP